MTGANTTGTNTTGANTGANTTGANTGANTTGAGAGMGAPIDRRQFILGSTSTMAALTVLPQLELMTAVPAALQVALGRPRPTFTTTLRRREDFVELDFQFYNLILRADGSTAQLVRLDPTRDTWVVVTFAPQSILEPAFADGSTPLPAPGQVVGHLAQPTRLAFSVPASVTAIPYDATGLLEWASWVQQVVPAARPGGPTTVAAALREPKQWETAIEIPWWLQLSPSAADGLWDSRTTPKTANDRTEIWHTQLRLPSRGLLTPPALRAVWARDFEYGTGAPQDQNLPGTPGQIGYPFQFQSLEPPDRGDIVLSSSYVRPNHPAPRPLQLNQLLLTALGGWLDVKGEWDTVDTGLSLESWLHRATGGRDQFVRVIRVGYLFPLGHRAVKVTITERKPGVPGGNAPKAAAYLRQRTFLVVRQPRRDYGGTGGADPDLGRGWPFGSIRLLTAITPDITEQQLGTIPTNAAFVPVVGGEPFLFEAIGVDHEQREVPFTAPLIWVDGAAHKPGGNGIYSRDNLESVIDEYMALPVTSPVRAEIPLPGSPLAMAPTTGDGPGGTSYDTRAMRMAVGPGNVPGQAALDALFPRSEPPFFPQLDYTDIRLEPATVVSGVTTPWTRASYLPAYVNGGFGVGEVFATFHDPVDVQFASGGRGGGVATPNLALTGLSRSLGVFGGTPSDVAAGVLKPADLFLGNAMLLGGLELDQVVQAGGLAEMPVLRTTTIGPAVAPTAIDTTMRWRPHLQPDPNGVLTVAGSTFRVDGKYRRELGSPASSTSLVTGELTNVALTLVPGAQFVKVSFDRIAFRSENGAKTEVAVDVGSVEFLGALRYLAKLADLVKTPDGAKSGPFLDVTPSMVTTGVAFALPAVQVGAFVLENIALRSEVRLPLTGAPVTTRFAFSTREDPFHLTVLALGGGGFAAIEIGADGPKALDVALEAGAMVALNVGVARGKLEAFAGLYYRLKQENGSTVSAYEAYLRMGGSLRVLGLVTVSSKIYIKLEYGNDKFHGSASLSYSIDFGLFEKSVSFTVKRQFAGDANDPFVTDRFSVVEWSDYCTAFALEAS